jgi:hypothetical protein
MTADLEATVDKVPILGLLDQNRSASARKHVPIIIGVLLMLAGIVFTLQGLGIVVLVAGLALKSKPAERPPSTEKPSQGT